MSNVERIPDNLQGDIPGTCMTYCPANDEATWLSTTVHNSFIFIIDCRWWWWSDDNDACEYRS